MGYEVLCVERVGDELIKLVRKGREFRVVNAPDEPGRNVHEAVHSVRLRFGTSEVAWLAFDFVVATERFWDAALRGQPRPRLRRVMRRTSAELRTAALRRHDPPGVTRLLDLLEENGAPAKALSLALSSGVEAIARADRRRPS